ncbi:hypothetical protein B0H14DRAFT_417352 [Mycena olivaceomarginata]|nr:hypothetical protein B0H14DRAFT_417352 [Mycena olivaceomarginata]
MSSPASDYGHTYASGSASASHTHARTPPSSYSHHSSAAHPQNPARRRPRRLQPSSAGRRPREPQAPRADVAPARRAHVLHRRLPAAAVIRAGRAAGPEYPRRAAAELTAQPAELVAKPAAGVRRCAALEWHGGVAPAAGAAATAAVACPHGWERGWWGRGKEGGVVETRAGGVAPRVALDAVVGEPCGLFAPDWGAGECADGERGDVFDNGLC